jgi:pantothenate kinase-related protein Tda10
MANIKDRRIHNVNKLKYKKDVRFYKNQYQILLLKYKELLPLMCHNYHCSLRWRYNAGLKLRGQGKKW